MERDFRRFSRLFSADFARRGFFSGDAKIALVVVLISIGILACGPFPILAVAFSALVAVHVLLNGYRVFWFYLVFLLLGYLFGDKGFAYIGVYPFYVGEAGLFLALVSIVVVSFTRPVSEAQRQLFTKPFVVLLLVFILWEMSRTLPYVEIYLWAAARDAVLWGYAFFAIAIIWLFPQTVLFRFLAIYRAVIPAFLMWGPITFVLEHFTDFDIRFPGAPVPLIYIKGGDVAVQLVGIGAFILLRIDRVTGKIWTERKVWLLWGLWLVNLATMFTGRAATLTILGGMGVVFLFRPRTRWDRPVVGMLVLLAVLYLSNLSISIGSRAISFQQLTSNLQSIVDSEGNKGLQGSKNWRLEWWNTIIDYTVKGEYFWTGKGYGINLADDDGFQVTADHSLRSPHSVHLTILARSGVPGAVLWCALWVGLFSMLAQRSLGKRRTASLLEGELAVWFLAYFIAFFVNAAFDVFLEGPMGGIWFWCLVGFAIAYLSHNPDDSEQPFSLVTDANS